MLNPKEWNDTIFRKINGAGNCHVAWDKTSSQGQESFVFFPKKNWGGGHEGKRETLLGGDGDKGGGQEWVSDG